MHPFRGQYFPVSGFVEHHLLEGVRAGVRAHFVCFFRDYSREEQNMFADAILTMHGRGNPTEHMSLPRARWLTRNVPPIWKLKGLPPPPVPEEFPRYVCDRCGKIPGKQVTPFTVKVKPRCRTCGGLVSVQAR